jgi:putative Mn2+ efflux pump MntP
MFETTIVMFMNAGLLSLDSLIVSLALSPFIRSSDKRWQLALLFGFCDSLATVIGLILRGADWDWHLSSQISPLFVFCFGVYFLLAFYWKKFRSNSNVIIFLPFLMSIDNLIYGIGGVSQSFNITAVIMISGFVSFFFSMLGFLIGRFIRFSDLHFSEKSAGFALVFAALFLILV